MGSVTGISSGAAISVSPAASDGGGSSCSPKGMLTIIGSEGSGSDATGVSSPSMGRSVGTSSGSSVSMGPLGSSSMVGSPAPLSPSMGRPSIGEFGASTPPLLSNGKTGSGSGGGSSGSGSGGGTSGSDAAGVSAPSTGPGGLLPPPPFVGVSTVFPPPSAGFSSSKTGSGSTKDSVGSSRLSSSDSRPPMFSSSSSNPGPGGDLLICPGEFLVCIKVALSRVLVRGGPVPTNWFPLESLARLRILSLRGSRNNHLSASSSCCCCSSRLSPPNRPSHILVDTNRSIIESKPNTKLLDLIVFVPAVFMEKARVFTVPLRMKCARSNAYDNDSRTNTPDPLLYSSTKPDRKRYP